MNNNKRQIRSTVPFEVKEDCRVCGSDNLHTVHDFGTVPLADKLTENPSDFVPAAPLTLHYCNLCHHLQIGEDVDPNLLFNDKYPYYSSQIPEVVRHFKDTFEAICREVQIGPDDTVVEIASNDGVLLRHFQQFTTRLIGIEPSTEHALITDSMGIKTYNLFFDGPAALRIARELEPGKVRLIMANNVLAHVPDPRSLVKGMALMLSDNGSVVVEVPYSLNIIGQNSFDVVFHQHYSYFCLHSLFRLFESEGMIINRLEKIDTQGGSFRLYIRKTGHSDTSVTRTLQEEKSAGLTELSTYLEFSANITAAKQSVVSGLRALKLNQQSIVGYGAPGKAATMLNYFGIDSTLLDYLVDISPSKQNLYFPFTGLKIHPIEKLYESPPDYVIILAWNYAASILKSLAPLRERGVRFLLPYPKLKEV